MRYLKYLVLLISGLFISWMIFGDALWHPNDYLMMDGGDGYIIYFNSFFHAIHGSGTTLTSMNFPNPDCIFMTDAQGVLSIINNYISSWLPTWPNYTAGSFHLLIIIGIIVHLFILHALLNQLDVTPWLCVVGAILIGSLSPQLVRVSYGHFGLAYPFIIPFTLLWLITPTNHNGFKIRTIFFIVVSLLFGFNNPYLLIITSILILAYGGIEIAFYKDRRKSGFLKLVLGFSFMGLLLFVLSILDPFDDRIQQQWGHFYYSSTLSGLFSGSYSLAHHYFNNFFNGWEFRSEANASISLTSILVITMASIIWGYKKVKGKVISFQINTPLIIIIWSAMIIFLYSSTMFRDKHWHSLISQIDIITMVKASGRLSWIPYYVLSVFSVTLLSKIMRQRRLLPFVFILLSLWTYEGYRYLSVHCKANLYDNHLHTSKLSAFIKPISQLVEFNEYQGIYNIPVSQSWNDNILTDGNWISEGHAYKIASATGIPLINSRLSRAPVRRSLENIQLSAHPLIKKHLLDKLDPNRHILLVVSNDYNTHSIGETAMLSVADTVYRSDQFNLYRLLPAEATFDFYRDSLLNNCKTPVSWHWENNFDDGNSTCGLYNNGSTVDKEWRNLATIEVPNNMTNDSFEMSIWSRVNIEKHGMPSFNLKVFDNTGLQVVDQYLDARRSLDTYNGWIRTAIPLNLDANYKVIFRGYGRYKMCVDEMLLRPTNKSDICKKDKEKVVAINNYFL